jgi:predicted phosphoadenosine phosphosulfate sulfurtransferase
MTNAGKIIFNVPLDFLSWTNDFAATASAVTQNVDSIQGVKERHLWVTGMVSKAARESLEQMGWVVHENSEGKVGMPAY